MMKLQYTVVEPEVSILVDIDVHESFRRRPGREDYYERNRPKLEKIRHLYRDEFMRHSLESCNHYFIIDGIGTVEEVHQRILDCVRSV
jgi:thymidylate kinase